MDLDRAMKERHSVRKFSSKKPDWRDIIECIDASRFSPMAGGSFTLKFIIVDDFSKIEKIADAAQQDFIKQAKYLVVVCSVPSRTINAYEDRGEIYIRQQAGAAIQNFLLKVTEKKLAACWVGAFVESQVKRTLKIPGNAQVEALIPIGYEFSKSSKSKRKIDIDNILYFNSYGNKRMKPLRRMDV